MEEDLKISKCKKFQHTCPHMDKPEMEKAMRFTSEKEPSESAGIFDPIAIWEDYKRANDKFCVNCNQFEE